MQITPGHCSPFSKIGREDTFEPATLHGVGPRVAEPAVGLNAQLYFAAPYEEMRLHKP